jgi:diphosphomevalonate decarboxylase
MKSTIIKTNPNIALIKYWGKRDESLFLPTKSSISFTLGSSLQNFVTTTKISIIENESDKVILNNNKVESQKITRFLNLFRKLYQVNDKFKIESLNSFPTSAGLSSSSSGFAALASGLNNLYNLNLNKKELSILARQGSGSACRSIHNGFVMWHKGNNIDGSDSYAKQIFDKNHWPEFKMYVVVVNKNKKKVSSSLGMQQTMKSCNFYNQWIKYSENKIPEMINAISKKDICKVGEIAETDCLQMHFCMQTTKPSINYWTTKTLEIINKVIELRKQGIPCYFTIDAGPNVKIITLSKYIKLFAN